MADDNQLPDLVDDLIQQLCASLDHPAERSSTGLHNDLNHLLTEFGANKSFEEEFVEKVEPTIQQNVSVPNSATCVRTNYVSPSIPSIPSVNSANDDTAVGDDFALQAAEDQIRDLESQGPAGLVDVSALGNVIDRPIQIWTSSMTLCHEVGKTRPGDPVHIQYHHQPGQIHGHWTLLGNRDPATVEANLNDCLFEAIAAQTGHKPSELRSATIEKMRRHINSLANRIQEVARLREANRIVLMVGGARYVGKSPSDARQVIDKSQEGRCHPGHMQGHPRGHASHPSATGNTSSAENYSRGGWKTAFLSREDQDEVCHQALCTDMAQQAMEALNSGGENRAITIAASRLPGPLPQAADFNDGERGRVKSIRDLVLVLRHHAGHAKDRDYDVFVHTFYPKL